MGGNRDCPGLRFENIRGYLFHALFPRYIQDNYTTNLLTGMVGMVHQLLGTMTLAPIYHLLQGKYTIAWILALSKAPEPSMATGSWMRVCRLLCCCSWQAGLVPFYPTNQSQGPHP